jgi:GAF domain-containing protein
MPSNLDSAIAVAKRVSALSRYGILGTTPEPEFDNLAQLALTVCQVHIATISFVDDQREWFKAALGIEVAELPIEESLSARAIAGPQMLVVPDATKNSRFAELPLIAGHEGIRFYAGAPLVSRTGTSIGMLSAMDRTPRANFAIEQRTALQTLANQVMAQLELRHTVQNLALALCQKHAAVAAANELRLLLPMCSDCKEIRNDDDYWQAVEQYLFTHTHTSPYLTHGICTECQEETSSPVSPRPQPYPKLLGSRFGRFAN